MPWKNIIKHNEKIINKGNNNHDYRNQHNNKNAIVEIKHLPYKCLNKKIIYNDTVKQHAINDHTQDL